MSFLRSLAHVYSAIIDMKGTCRAKSGGCCKHVGAALYQLV